MGLLEPTLEALRSTVASAGGPARVLGFYAEMIGERSGLDASLTGHHIFEGRCMVTADPVEIDAENEAGAHDRRRMASWASGAKVPNAVADHRSVAA